ADRDARRGPRARHRRRQPHRGADDVPPRRGRGARGVNAPSPNTARLEVRRGPLVGAVLSRVVGMLAARALCPIDRLDDALLITDAIAAHAGDFTFNGTVGVTVIADSDAITLLVAPLCDDGADGLRQAAELPGVG